MLQLSWLEYLLLHLTERFGFYSSYEHAYVLTIIIIIIEGVLEKQVYTLSLKDLIKNTEKKFLTVKDMILSENSMQSSAYL